MKLRVLATILILMSAVSLIYICITEPRLWSYIVLAVMILIALAALVGIYFIWRRPLRQITISDSSEKQKRILHREITFDNRWDEADVLDKQEYFDRNTYRKRTK